jgi:hypothetical protein
LSTEADFSDAASGRPSLSVGQRSPTFAVRERAPIDVAVFLLLGIGLVLRLAFLKEHFNVDWEPDGYEHVIVSKSVFAAPPATLRYAVDVWAKPLYTLLFATVYKVLPSLPAIVVTQVINSAMWIAAAAITLSIARMHFQNRRTLIILAAFAAFAYVSFRASVSANTEPFGALIFAVGLWLFQRGRTTVAMLVLGSEILIRTDAVFCVVVFALWEMARALLARDTGVAGRIWRSFRYGAAFALPLLIWNFVGFLLTGSPLFVITNGYPSTAGIYGFGSLAYYVREFVLFDTLLFVSVVAGITLILIRRPSALLVVSAIAASVYFLAMVMIWSFGAFGSAGLLRYFVFQYPLWLLIAGVSIEAAVNGLQRRAPRWVDSMVVVVCLAAVMQLHWLVREPRWYNNVQTRVTDNPARELPALMAQWSALPLHTDRPDILYYFGRSKHYGYQHPLATVRQPDQPGIFVFTQGWTEQYSALTAKDFAGLEEKATVHGPWGEIFHLYVRQ